jgi:hypothetical protein
MSTVPVRVTLQRLLASVRSLEQQLRAIGLPHAMARLPVFWLCWHYCRILQRKIVRMRRIAAKFQHWLDTVRKMAADSAACLEMLDLDKGMTDEVESTRQRLWELRDCCLEIGAMFEQLGYASSRLRRSQDEFLRIIAASYEMAGLLQAELARHDNAVLALLRDMRARELAACGPLPGV